MKQTHTTITAQRGGTTLGIIVGVVLGLAVALGVSLYIAYSGAPLQTKAANTAARIEPPADPSKIPDPNQSLYVKVPKTDDTKRDDTKTGDTKDSNNAKEKDAKGTSVETKPNVVVGAPANKAAEQDGIGKIATIVTPPKAAQPTMTAATAAGTSATTTESITMPKAANAAAGERYFVQAGAFANTAEAESMKAKLALQGVSMTLSPRDKDGQILQRVRTAPLAAVDAERLRNTLKANGIETSLVKVQ